jgi:predicted nucleic acid-binding Zn ribbon protein
MIGPRRPPGDPEPIGELIQPLLKELKIVGRRVGKELHRVWLETAGPDLAHRTRLVSLRSGKLVVEVDSAALLQELQSFRAPELLARLRDLMPNPPVNEIRFRLGAFGSQEPPA